MRRTFDDGAVVRARELRGLVVDLTVAREMSLQIHLFIASHDGAVLVDGTRDGGWQGELQDTQDEEYLDS